MNFSNISEDYFRDLKEVSDKSLNFINELKSNQSFCDYLLKERSGGEAGNAKAPEIINFLFLVDLARCFRLVSDISNMDSKESFALLFLQSNLLGLQLDDFNQVNYIIASNKSDVLDHFKAIIENLKGEINRSHIEDEDFLELAYKLNYFGPNLKQEYLKNLYQFLSLVIKLDGTVSEYEEYVLKNIIRRKYADNRSQLRIDNNMEDDKVSSMASPVSTEKSSLDSILKELNSLTGLVNVKAEINTLVNFIKVQKSRQLVGLKRATVSYHLVFTGNPGTGKTTIARIISKIYQALGVLSIGQLIETDRSGLVAEYLGQTAIKVNKTINTALNGVLFIDEAYALTEKENDNYGQEAISTLIKRMEDDRDKLVVIVAGYTKQMKDFINANPGFKSRFNRYIEFVDYSPAELFSIFESLVDQLGNELTEDARSKVQQLFAQAYSERDSSFGNGRFVRNIFEKTLENQANRIAGIANISKEILEMITDADIPVN